MPESKRNALDILDSYLNNKKYQDQFKLIPGEILIINNNLLAHGRTSFSINNNKGQRDYLRVWIK
jgi:alpha-ketoglutarate-dependent taurine dioxygenase